MLKGCVVAMLLAAVAGGCASHASPRESLAGAYRELEQPGPNYLTMMAAADAYLAEQPNGPASADAYYLRGRALEEKAGKDPTSPAQDIAQAHQAYNQALTRQPRSELAALIHAGVGNVLYFQNRYAEAVGELSASYDNLPKPQDKAWTLYRIGLCQQRLGQWDQADRTFVTVQQQFPGTEQARRAREHQGAKAFFVQVGIYAAPAQADAVVADLKKQGITAMRYADPAAPKGTQYVRVGPLPTYQAAAAMKQRVWSKYNAATILP